jgi:hypothetical protein
MAGELPPFPLGVFALLVSLLVAGGVYASSKSPEVSAMTFSAMLFLFAGFGAWDWWVAGAGALASFIFLLAVQKNG